MKKTDYILILAPMISDLGLKGNSLLLFALIHGFTKDGKQRFRGSLNYMAEWLNTSKAAVSSVLRSLEESGYITRHINYVGGIEAPEYTTNYEELLDKVTHEGALIPRRVFIKGTESVPPSDVSLVKGTESVPVLNQYQKGYCFSNERGTESVTNNIIDNIYYSFYWELSPQEKQQEEKNFLKIFFFGGSADPLGEVRRFVAHNSTQGWKSAKTEYNSADKRQSLAHLWKYTLGQRELDLEFMALWKSVYESVEDVKGAECLLDTSISIIKGDRQMAITCKKSTMEWMEQNCSKFGGILTKYAAGKKITYKII
jgi:DNA-binding MarR family transcriptional regulator